MTLCASPALFVQGRGFCAKPLGVVTIREFMAQSHTQCEIGPELHRVLYKPGSHPNSKRYRRRGLCHREERRFALKECRQRAKVELSITSTEIGALQPF